MKARQRYFAAASGAPEDSAFDLVLLDRWVSWRTSYPIRAPEGVKRTFEPRPKLKPEQKEWCLYTNRAPGQDDRIMQEWWMPPFLVPICRRCPSTRGNGGGGFVAVLC